MTGDGARIPVAALIVSAAIVLALLLAAPGETITTAYVNDLFIFLDGAHRVVSGQVPNRDFHTALGPIAFYLPALGYWVSGDFGSAMPTAMAMMTFSLALPLAHILNSRLQPVIAVLFGIFLLLIAAVPMNLGESIASLSFAMFYNRIGWVGLSALLVMYLPPARSHAYQDGLDTLCAAFLTLVMIYSKITYGLVAVAFLVFMLFDRQQLRWAAGALCLILLTALAVEAIWRSSVAYWTDLILTSRVSGSRGIVDLAAGFMRHLADYVILAIFVALALWRTHSMRDLMFFGICAGPGLLIQNQNSQPWGIITLHAGAAVAAEMLLRQRMTQASACNNLARVSAGAPFLLLAFLLPTILHCFMALGLHTALASTRSGEAFGLPQFNRIRLARLWSPGDHDFSTAYLTSIRDGVRLLADLPQTPRQVSVLDFSNPFSAGLGLPPARGDNAWLHWRRNISSEHFLPPEHVFGDVEILMEPKWGINSAPLRDLYGDYVHTAFEPIRETDFWIVQRRRMHPIVTGASPGGEPAQLSRNGGWGAPP